MKIVEARLIPMTLRSGDPCRGDPCRGDPCRGDPCRGGRGPADREPLPDRRHRSLPIDDGSCGRTGSRSWRRPD
ncbi:protein of unassigned function [Methylobacterium oryzae CBMB20]|uniref:Protein of unassigned function n=1 Tax=Methylobacterium oryzae CBMB20 TaxID=693986 RepID=A0A089NVY1_9HYPH|nr:protein of unassigned function [Methylobacterium oryzae CBMB20]